MKPEDFELPASLSSHEHIRDKLFWPFHNQLAVTLRPLGIFYVQGHYTYPIRCHEFSHFRDQRRWLYIPYYIAYGVLLLWESVILRRPADELTMEKEGYRIEREAERREKEKRQ